MLTLACSLWFWFYLHLKSHIFSPLTFNIIVLFTKYLLNITTRLFHMLFLHVIKHYVIYILVLVYEVALESKCNGLLGVMSLFYRLALLCSLSFLQQAYNIDTFVLFSV